MFFRPRFSLRMLTFAVVLVAILSAVLHYRVQAVKRDAALEREVIAWLRAEAWLRSEDGRYSSRRKDYGVLINSLVSNGERERISSVSLYGLMLGSGRSERELVTALSKLKDLESVMFILPFVHRDVVDGAGSVGRELRVSVFVSS